MEEYFGDYRLIERIGIGGMAEVFLARRSGVAGFEKEIVIKRIRPHLNEQKSFVNMFLGEAKLATQLTHPNIVQIYDLGRIDNSYFIAMEYIPGRDMSAIIPKTKSNNVPFPVEYVLKIASSLCEALHYAHNKKDIVGNSLEIVHRDVSPENIRIAWTGTVKILDFGIAKAATQVHETKVGEIKGKLCYMSPEQVLGQDVDSRSDIFALGCVMYEAITGFKLYSGNNDLEIMNKIIDGKVYPPSYFRNDVPEEVERIIMKALAKERRKRFQSAFEMQLTIDKFLTTNEFTPSSIHLANFLKQQFQAELDAEHTRRRNQPLSPSPTRTPPPFRPRDYAMSSANNDQENREFTDLIDTKQISGPLKQLSINLPAPLLHKLDKLAKHHEQPLEDLITNLLRDWAKYLPD
ncbi:MAG: serine/threonine-protein kinase [Myxococcota bacterium]|nr:serine/threonine-protein kinase [Myxococcota bacterium]